MEVNMIDINNNNELAKPMAKNTQNIYANNSDQNQPVNGGNNPYDMEQPNQNINTYPIEQKQIIIVEPSIENERPADWLCFGQDSLENRARMNFIRKVYMLLGVQLLVTIGFCCLSYFVKPFFQFQMDYWWVTLIAIAFMYIIMGIILCTESSRRYPFNLVWLIMFTLSFSYLISQVTSVYAYYYGGPLVLIAAGLTLFMVLGLTLFAIFSKNDFRVMFGIMIVLLFSFVGFGFLCIFTLSPILYQLYCAIAVAILGILLVVDTKIIIGGGKSIQISMDDYILGSLILYIDIMRLFLIILQLLGGSRR